MAKGGELGVLDSYEDIDTEMSGIRKALSGVRKAVRSRDRERGIKNALRGIADALNNVRDLETALGKGRRDAQKLQKKADAIIEDLQTSVLPLIEKKKKRDS